ncbi:riboflavin synthase [Desnuesiella massiliensis]|uniref:riboflavin synthase n=1 Tax=Desnuesiella massiliensis TaxID=1650662 RepID=UPI0006E15646|nr:riboflavin synthase [Desnuesiella massiliensis]
MFTGLIEEIGKIEAIAKGERSARLTIKAEKIIEDLNIGDSISTNGVCLTVTSFSRNTFTVDVMAETMRRSNLGDLCTGEEVNLERAMKAEGRFGGHIVSGHIDGIGKIISLEKEDNATCISISTQSNLLKYIVEKGSITIDGISLTVTYVNDQRFTVCIIPHTAKETTLLNKNIGDMVNLECDIIGKYVEKLLNFKTLEDKASNITADFLKSNGFM